MFNKEVKWRLSSKWDSYLTWRRSLLSKNQSINLQSKSVNWLLYDRYFLHERAKGLVKNDQFNAHITRRRPTETATGGFLKRCSQKFRKFHRKTPVLESLFNYWGIILTIAVTLLLMVVFRSESLKST